MFLSVSVSSSANVDHLHLVFFFLTVVRARIMKLGTHLCQHITLLHAPIVSLTYMSWYTDFEKIPVNVC